MHIHTFWNSETFILKGSSFNRQQQVARLKQQQQQQLARQKQIIIITALVVWANKSRTKQQVKRGDKESERGKDSQYIKEAAALASAAAMTTVVLQFERGKSKKELDGALADGS